MEMKCTYCQMLAKEIRECPCCRPEPPEPKPPKILKHPHRKAYLANYYKANRDKKIKAALNRYYELKANGGDVRDAGSDVP